MKKMETMAGFERAYFPADGRSDAREASGLSVTVISLPSRDLSAVGTILDISRSGVGLRIGRPLKPGASMALTWDDTIILAEVVYCIKEEKNYRAGLKTSYIILDRTGTPAQESWMLQ